MQRLATLLVLLLFAPGAALAQDSTFVINEADYDQPGTDDAEFIEIYNTTDVALDLGGYEVELVGVSGGAASVYRTITIPAGTTVPADGFYVICSDPASGLAPLCDQDIAAGSNFIRDGRNNAIGLSDDAGNVIDAVAYEGVVPGYTEDGPVDPGDDGTTEEETIARIPDGRDDNNNDSDFDAGFRTPGLANQELPVEFAGFTAQTDGADVLLQWTTASEQSNAGFQVQRRTVEGGFVDVEGAFIATKAPSGNSLEAIDYDYRLEGLSAGTHAFRLKQTDYDGAFDYSSTVEVSVAPALRVSEVYPNPFRSGARLELSVPTAQSRVTVEVYNILGQRVALLHDGPVAAGETLRPHLSASGLSSGLYLIRVQSETFSEVRRVTLVK